MCDVSRAAGAGAAAGAAKGRPIHFITSLHFYFYFTSTEFCCVEKRF